MLFVAACFLAVVAAGTMGRSRKDGAGKAGRDISAQRSAQADLVWPLFLQHMISNDSRNEHQLVCCKLLCCSKAMAQQVHSTAAGQLQVSIPGRPPARKSAGKPDPQHADHFKLVSRWLGRNAKLLKSLALQKGATTFAPADEQALAAALAAAAAAGSNSASSSNRTACGPVTRSTAVVIRAAAAAAAAARAGAAEDGQQQQEGLPLQELSVDWHWYALRGSLLCALSVACPHLRRLTVSTSDAAINPDAVRALGCLTSLRDLSWSQAQGYVGRIAPAVERLARLTRLYVSGAVLGEQFPAQLPAALVQLRLPGPGWWATPPLQFSYLTNLQQFTYGGRLHGASDELPASLTQLKVRNCHSHQPLLPLQNLRSLSFDWERNLSAPCHLSVVMQLQQLELCSSYSFHSVGGVRKWDDFFVSVDLPSSLLELSLNGFAKFGVSACESLAALTQLQKLTLSNATLAAAPAQLGAALRKLVQLVELYLCPACLEVPLAAWRANDGLDRATATEMQPLYVCVASMPALQQLSASNTPLSSAAVSALASATQLTSLWLEQCDLMAEHSSALRAGLTQLRSLHCLEGQSKHTVGCGR